MAFFIYTLKNQSRMVAGSGNAREASYEPWNYHALFVFKGGTMKIIDHGKLSEKRIKRITMVLTRSQKEFNKFLRHQRCEVEKGRAWLWAEK
jgi:hypothetical protein